MRSRLAFLLLASVVLTSPVAQAQVPGDGFKSNNVEWLGNIGETAPAAATLKGRFLYVANDRWLDVYDVSDAQAPRRVGGHETGAEVLGPNASGTIATDGQILLHRQSYDVASYIGSQGCTEEKLTILDVSDPTMPLPIADLAYPDEQFSWSCLFGCRWAYGTQGAILDLRQPRSPRLLEHEWDEDLEMVSVREDPSAGCVHIDAATRPSETLQVTEVAPGKVLTGSIPMYLLDVDDPTRPRVLGTSDGSPYSLGGVARPGMGRWILSFNITGADKPRCELVQENSTDDSGFATWDASAWRDDEHVAPADVYRLKNGTYQDGDPVLSAPPGAAGCVPGWFDPHPGFRVNGVVAVTSPGHGVKFVKVGRTGKIRELGHFLPHAGMIFDGQWVSEDIFYTIDFYRGIDILRFSGDA